MNKYPTNDEFQDAVQWMIKMVEETNFMMIKRWMINRHFYKESVPTLDEQSQFIIELVNRNKSFIIDGCELDYADELEIIGQNCLKIIVDELLVHCYSKLNIDLEKLFIQ